MVRNLRYKMSRSELAVRNSVGTIGNRRGIYNTMDNVDLTVNICMAYAGEGRGEWMKKLEKS